MTVAEQIIKFVEEYAKAINEMEYGEVHLEFQHHAVARAELTRKLTFKQGTAPPVTTPPIASHQK